MNLPNRKATTDVASQRSHTISSPFADLGVPSKLADALRARGVTQPFPVQSLVIPDVLDGEDVLVKSPTGSGKTLAFGLPLVTRIQADDRRSAALILAPTRELVQQIVEEIMPLAQARALTMAAIYGGAGLQKQAKLARKAHILVATPGRLEDLMERGDVSLAHLRVLVLDEADRMLDMGFRPAVDRIVKQAPRDRQTLFFSATLEGDVGKLARAYTRDPRSHSQAATHEQRGDVLHHFVPVTQDSKLDTLVRHLRDGDRGLTLVFVRTKHGADRLVKRLRTREIEAVAMHGNKSQAQREKALARFGRGQVDTLVATDVAARGIHVDDITHVINFDAPGASDDYVHRVGRTARAGRTGTGVTFVSPEQADDVGKIARTLKLESEFAESGLVSRAPARNGGGRRSNNGGTNNGRGTGGGTYRSRRPRRRR